MHSDKIEGKVQEVAGRAEGGLGDAFGDTQASVSGRLRETRGMAQSALGDVKDQVGDAASEVVTAAQEVYENRDRYAAQGKRTIEAQISDNPMLALTVAALIGLFIGALLAVTDDRPTGAAELSRQSAVAGAVDLA